jgi:hypothetical protein
MGPVPLPILIALRRKETQAPPTRSSLDALPVLCVVLASVIAGYLALKARKHVLTGDTGNERLSPRQRIFHRRPFLS